MYVILGYISSLFLIVSTVQLIECVEEANTGTIGSIDPDAM